MSLAFLLLIVYSAALVGFGLWISRFVRDSSAFFVAGRSLTAPLLFATVLASNIGAGSTVGAAGLAYTDGISAWWWNGASAIGSLGLAFWVGPKIWQLASRHNFYTAGDYLEFRYSAAVRGVIAALIWLGTLAILAGQLMAGAAVLNIVAGLPRWAGTAASAAVMTIYFVAGGLLSSAWVNAVQLVVLVTGLLLAIPLGLVAVGGLDIVMHGADVPEHFDRFWYSSGPGSGWTRLILMGPAFIISPGLLQKAYGAASPRAIRLGLGWQAMALALFAFVPVLLGMMARASNPNIASPNLVLPTLLGEQLPPWIGALGLAAIFSAEVSTCDAILFMLATSLSKDLYKRFVRPQATDRQVLTVARGAAVAGGVGGVVLALVLQTVQQALDIFYALLTVSLMVPIVGGLYVRRATTLHAFSAIIAGVTTLVVFRMFLAATSRWLDPTLWGLVAAVVAFTVALAVRPAREAS
ncbi:MAG TPA: sodium:solute symporter family protein [Vicinamibacterales bacterium]|nr:sodium:solute symporter family protein [Vicinamibacterales bacterium]